MNRQTLLRRFYRTRISGGDPIREALDGLQFQLSPGGELNWKTFPGEINPSIIQRYGSGRPYFNDFDLLTAQQTYVSPAMATPNAYLINANSGWRSFEDFILSLNPTAYWPLDDAPGSTVARDATGKNQNLIVAGGVTFGQPGLTAFGETCASFTGSQGLTGNIRRSNAETLMMLVEYPTANGSYSQIAGFSDAGLAINSFPSSNASYPNWPYFAPNGIQLFSSLVGNVSLAGTSRSNGNVFGFQDNNLSVSFSDSVSPLPPFSIGSSNQSEGKIAHVAILPYQITQSQINQINAVLSAGPLYGIFTRNGV